MERLSIEYFFTSETDWETNQYRILGSLQKVRSDFGKNKIYPSFALLTELKQSIEKLKDEKNKLTENFPKQIKGFDVKKKKVIYESSPTAKRIDDIEKIFDLIEWALPYINDAINEGTALYDFVEKNIELEQVGVLPIYRDEGYFMVTDNTACELQIHRYECTIFTSSKENYRALKTRFVKSERQIIIRKPPAAIKHELIKERKDLPNPATFLFDTELDFPFTETIFPVVKRKLVSHIAS